MTLREQPVEAASGESPAGRSLPYQPALDGVRALAVIAVLLFHGEVPGFSGGYLGVSVFFTLSGYLITSLLVVEVERTGRVGVSRFYARRVRRLLPASLACIAGVLAIAALTDWFEGVSTLRRDAIGALLQVANWVFLFGDGSYQELFDEATGTVSPLEHYWSLAIEEQFYWLWPLAFIGIGVAVGRSARARRGTVLVLTALSAIAAPVIAAVWGADAAYWATPARAAEILMGASLAVLLAGRSVRHTWSWLAPVALVGLGAMVVFFPATGGPAYSGALPLVAVVSAALLLGLQADGPLRRVLAVSPLVWIGTVSYGVYLYHWPVFVVLDENRTGWDGVPLLAARLAITFAIAAVSFVVLERPVRHAAGISRRATAFGGIGLTAAMVLGAVLVVPAAGSQYWSIDEEVAGAAGIETAEGTLVPLAPVSPATSTGSSTGSTTAPTMSTPTTASAVADAGATAPSGSADPDTAAAAPVPAAAVPASTSTTTTTIAPQPPLPEGLPRPVRILLAGDSTAEALGSGLLSWSAANPALAETEVSAGPGCGFVRGGNYTTLEVDWQPGCGHWAHVHLPELAAEKQVDVVALMTTSWDVAARRWPDGMEGTVLDDDVAAYVAAELTSMTQSFLDRGVTVAWIRHTNPYPKWEQHETDDPALHEVMYGIMEGLAAAHPGDVYTVDLAGHTADLQFDREARPDGVHWTPEVATAIATDYLGEELIRAALDLEPR